MLAAPALGRWQRSEDYDLSIAVSEYEEFPAQSLFRISSLYNPEIKAWDTETNDPKAIIEYGSYDENKELVLRIGFQKIEIEKKSSVNATYMSGSGIKNLLVYCAK